MVFDAILTLKERGGSSVQAIKKHIVTKYPDLAFAPHQLRSALKKGCAAEKFIKVRVMRNKKKPSRAVVAKTKQSAIFVLQPTWPRPMV